MISHKTQDTSHKIEGKTGQPKKALLIDANALIHRAWHALPPMTDNKGMMVNAVYGFSSVLIKVLDEQKPDVLAVCWDTPEPTFRHKAREDYKAHRVEQGEEFYAQIPLAQKAAEVLGGTNIELPGYEADDILGTLACRLEKAGYKVTILTGDKDALQLVSDDINVMAFKKGVSETIIYNPETLVALTGLRADQIAEYKALRGDPSDNLPGISGIGEKTATELLVKYDNLEGVFKAAHDAASDMKDGVRKKLLEGESMAEEMLPLVRIVTKAPVKENEKDLVRRALDESAYLTFFSNLGFKSLVKRIVDQQPESYKAKPSSKKSPKANKLGQNDAKAFFRQTEKEKTLFIHLPQNLQASFFDSPAALVLGNEDQNISFTKDDIKAHKTELAALLADKETKKIGHGLKEICHWAKANLDARIDGLYFDTELASYLLMAGERSHDLKTVCGVYLKRVLDESQMDQDLQALRELVPLLKAEMEKQNLTFVFDKIEMPLINVLSDMEAEGIRIDVDYLKKVSLELTAQKNKLEKQMHEMAGEEFNPLSPKQLSHILFEVLKVPLKGIKRGKTGISTAASELEKLAGTHPIINLIEEYRELSKLLSTYVDTLPTIADGNGRVHTTFNQAITATGRLSSSDPNLQNIPARTEIGRQVRRAFIANPGHVLLSCDYSQIELRIAAALAKDKNMLEAFENGADIHTATAAKIWDLKLEDVTKDQRRIAKAINFGLIFGQGPQGLSRTAGISFDEAREFISKYFEAFSGIKDWMDWSRSIAAEQEYVETLFGRRRYLPEIHSPIQPIRAQAERMAINMPIQGTEADLIKLAMIKIAEELPDISNETKMLLQVHDELIFEVPEKLVKNIAPKIVDLMQNVEKIGCPIIVDAKYGKNWEEMTKI